MPYILENKRKLYGTYLYMTGRWLNESNCVEGELNYFISKLCDGILHEKGANYALINKLIGSLECCKLELYRRIAAPYEDKKIIGNGDVYGTQI